MSEKSSPGLYFDETTGQRISTHSMLKTFRRCPKQAEFKYVHRLKPRMLGSPLKRGKWVHELLEIHHQGGDWLKHHKKLSSRFNDLFDEEKDFYGDMPTEIEQVMRSYIWHYAKDPWVIKETEFTIEAEFPDGTLYRGMVDSLVETEFGLFIVDHKTHKTLPDHNFRLLDAQSALYLWACRENGLDVQGFIWNYIRWKAPSKPQLLAAGNRISDRVTDTDFPTMYNALVEYKKDYPQFSVREKDKDKLRYLKGLQYEHGKPQESSFFRRVIMEKDDAMLNRVLTENFHTSLRMHDYNFSATDAVERVVDRSCTFSCSYTDICTAQLLTGSADILIKQNYTKGDPNDYYKDRAGDAPEKDS